MERVESREDWCSLDRVERVWIGSKGLTSKRPRRGEEVVKTTFLLAYLREQIKAG